MNLEKRSERRKERRIEAVPSADEGTRVYSLESGTDVTVSWKVSEPNTIDDWHSEEPHNHALIFLPGIEVNAADKTTEGLNQAFANAGKLPSYAVTTESKKREGATDVAETLLEESRAISDFIKEHGLKEITIAGYSVGGSKAIDVASILQNDPDIRISGVVLLASVGLYDQKPMELTKNLLADSFVHTPKNLLREKGVIPAFGQWLRVATDVGSHLVGNAITSPGHISRLRQGVTEMSRLNPRISEISAPVILVSGEQDVVSDAGKVIPDENIVKEEREAYLQEHLFKKSPYVRMVIPKKQSNHGLPYYRSESVANASLYLLDRFHRAEKNAE